MSAYHLFVHRRYRELQRERSGTRSFVFIREIAAEWKALGAGARAEIEAEWIAVVRDGGGAPAPQEG
jgi:hypothetical protein